MNQIVSNLLVYGKLPEDSILWQLSDICMRLKTSFLYPLIMPLIKTSGRIT